MVRLVEFRFYFYFFYGDSNLFLLISSSWVNVRLHTRNWLCNLPKSALNVPVGGWLESESSDRLWLSFSLGCNIIVFCLDL